ncbi:metal-dependent phosphohydrolase [Leptolyngbya valderiana BDU 20041]|uniref:Npun_R2479 family HD domain-containing metalloprotein n=1 Tax=Baaleninema simplex TaxID=2862350 RepID=UPI000369BCE6|nr:Npun_R2479 family HD domain-containing metalloprotein [Baaleninema simplex]MDC0831850.1 metal-dependent phosphohydrolase [Geitlerinema sp. CS-897]OAB63813.1 metal-dependent phosphohydrolase [Leptolyngbya valderiana BDU 20041]
MFNATEILIQNFVERLREGYHRTYGGYKPDYADIIAWAGGMALENIANSDALYHNVEHTIGVTLVGQEILRGKHIREGGITCEDWLHFIISLVCSDIGFVKGVCRQDRIEDNQFDSGTSKLVSLDPGATDASLAPYHVDRSKLFVDERFSGHRLIVAEAIKRNIEYTRQQSPNVEGYEDTSSYPGLLRAADLIGQLSDPRYLNKLGALYYEYEETGLNRELGYQHAGDLRRSHSKQYWGVIYPAIENALEYLSLTQEGKQIIANLYANVFVVEHDTSQAMSPSGIIKKR